MEGLVFGITVVALAAALGRFAVDSRPGVGDDWSGRQERWYPGP